jgi:glycosyltransferase involved in cell wall biosynthesis
MGTYARVVQALAGVPFVSSMHNPVPPTSRLFAKTTFLGARAIADSSEIATILTRDYGVDADRVVVVTPGVDATRFRPPNVEERTEARRYFDVRPGQFVLAFVASLVPRKRADTLIDAMAHLLGSGLDVVALIAGHGPDEDALHDLTSTLGISSNVRFIGYQDSRRVEWAADALVLPSESEGSPLVVVEAMLTGVVAVCTPAAGVQLQPDITGVIFPYGDHQELARRIADLIQRPDHQKALATRALDDARERLSSRAMAQSIEARYADVVAGGR